MTAKRMFYLLSTLVILLSIGVVGVGYVANAALTSKSNELSKLKAEAEATQSLQSLLQKNKSDLVRYKELNNIARAVVPQDKDQAQTVGEINKIARESGISRLASISFPASTLGAVTATKPAGGITQVTPVAGISGVYLLPITVTVDPNRPVTYGQFVTFLKKLEQNRRTAQVTDISLKPDPKNPNAISFTLVVNEYIKP
ncbi:MAG: hypothetical protein WAS36_02115 [Candidatus Saccharimonadales bacterium]